MKTTSIYHRIYTRILVLLWINVVIIRVLVTSSMSLGFHDYHQQCIIESHSCDYVNLYFVSFDCTLLENKRTATTTTVAVANTNTNANTTNNNNNNNQPPLPPLLVGMKDYCVRLANAKRFPLIRSNEQSKWHEQGYCEKCGEANHLTINCFHKQATDSMPRLSDRLAIRANCAVSSITEGETKTH